MPAIVRVCFLIFVYFGFLLSFPINVLSYFNEDFTNYPLDSQVWQVYQNSGSVLTENSKLTLARSVSPSYSFPYIYSKNNIFPSTGSFSVRIKYRYLSTGNFGDGITISPGEVPQNTTNPDSNLFTYMTFMVYQDATNGLSFGKFLCDVNGHNCNTRTFLRPFTHVADLDNHELRIDYNDLGQYFIYLDGSQTPEFISGFNQRRPQRIWIGNSLQTNTVDYWSSLEIDYIKVEQLGSSNSVVLLPGFGGSWDVGAVLAGTEGTHWEIPPFVKNYDGIIQSFKNAGYVEGTDLFVFPYDWRKPLTNLADDLKSFIDSKNITGKVDLVGHSMGGLVARAYAQKHGVAKVDKIMTAGSPHKGIIDMYGLWEGAKLWDNSWWQNVLLEIATEINKLPGEQEIAAIRRISPSIIDLFPTFPFLMTTSGLKGIDTMIEKNNYLKSLNDDVGDLEDRLTPFWSDDIAETRNTIKVSPRGILDTLQGKWTDGKPIEDNPFGVSQGDGTVTKISAVGPFGAGEKLTGWHGDLLASKENIEKIFTKLGIDTAAVVSAPETDKRKNSFVAILRSPGTLEVCDVLLLHCNDELGRYFPEFKLFILPGYNNEDLVVRIKEAGFGPYTLHLGKITEAAKWERLAGNLEVLNQVDTYNVIRGRVYPGNKKECKKGWWKRFTEASFRNQGECVSYTERNERAGRDRN